MLQKTYLKHIKNFKQYAFKKPAFNAKSAFKKIKSAIFPLFLCAFAFVLVLNPQKFASSALEGLKLWGLTVIPSLLPFFFISSALSRTSAVYKLCKKLSRLTDFLYRADGAAAFVQAMSFISGYPVGASLIVELKEQNAIDDKTATKFCTFCSTAGPGFVIGAVGGGMLGNESAGAILFLSHVLSAVFNGILFRKHCDNRPIGALLQKNKQQNFLSECAYSTAISCLCSGTLIILFYVICDVILSYGLLSPIIFALKIFLADEKKAEALIVGFIECTRGCKMLAATGGTLKLPLISAVISFGGASVIAQSLVFLKSAGVKSKFFILAKLSQAIFAFFICSLFCLIFR